MVKQDIISILKGLTNHDHAGITTRGNSAIKTVLSILPENSKILIPEEGGWLTYKDLPEKLGLQYEEVRCDDAGINLKNLKQKLNEEKFSAFLYHNPGGYFAEQDSEGIYRLCKENGCLVIMDVSGSLGTELCDGNYADILLGSFGRWKLVDAGKGGFISSNDENLWKEIEKNLQELDDEEVMEKISHKLEQLPERKKMLEDARKKVINDLKDFEIVYPDDYGLVVVVKFSTEEEKETLINYCKLNNLEWTECPRYIRLNKKAISIEIKRL